MMRTSFVSRFLRAALYAAALVAGAAHGQAFPAKPIHLVVPYPPGGSADLLARELGQKLAARMGQPIVIENRGGAGATIGAKAVAAAPADGYTLLLGTVSSNAMSPAVNKVGYDPVKDFTAITRVASIPFVLLAHPSLPVNNLSELIALAKARPGEITYASAGNGTSNHLAGELLASAASIKLLHVAFKGSAPALNDLLGGHVQTMFDLQLTALPHIKAGKVKALALTGKKRSTLLPDVPTAIEAGVPGYDVTAWFGVMGPAGMPKAVVDRLNGELVGILKTDEIQKKFQELGVDTEWSTPEEFAAFMRDESARWTGVVKSAGISQ